MSHHVSSEQRSEVTRVQSRRSAAGTSLAAGRQLLRQGWGCLTGQGVGLDGVLDGLQGLAVAGEHQHLLGSGARSLQIC